MKNVIEESSKTPWWKIYFIKHFSNPMKEEFCSRCGNPLVGDFEKIQEKIISEAIARDRAELREKIQEKKIYIEQRQVGCIKCDLWRERVSHNSEGFFCSGCGKKETTRIEKLNGDFETNELIDSVLSLLDSDNTKL